MEINMLQIMRSGFEGLDCRGVGFVGLRVQVLIKGVEWYIVSDWQTL